MTVHDVHYTQFSIPPTPAFPKGRVVRRPALVVKLVNGGNTLSCVAIVDSGADNCAFPRSFMQPLGIDALNCPSDTTYGVGGASPTHFANIEIDFGPAKIPVYAAFTTGLDAIGFGLLGQVGFFDKLNITFKHSQGLFQIEVP